MYEVKKKYFIYNNQLSFSNLFILNEVIIQYKK